MYYVIFVIIALGLIGLLLYRRCLDYVGDNNDVRSKAQSKAPSGYKVEIRQKGRYGDILYSEKGDNVVFGWEFGGTVIVVIDIPSESRWIKDVKFPVSQRKEIAERVAREVIRQKAPGSSFLWSGDMVQIT